MVIDIDLESTKKVVLEWIKEKDRIQEELQELKVILHKYNVGMDEPLVDPDGYPRADLDVYNIRHVRQKIICLQNDNENLLKKIEEGLINVHAIARNARLPDAPADQGANVSNEVGTDEVVLSEPFLQVNLVSPGSPAELAGIELNDLIVEFGSINSQNFKNLKDIGALVDQSRYKPIDVKVKRNDIIIVTLSLTPRPWTGKGLLGCNVIPVEMVER